MNRIEAPRRRSRSMPQFLARLIGFCVLVLASWSAQASATGPWAVHELARARLISAVTATGSSETLPLGIEVAVKPGWKTYWRSPGDAGLPPAITLADQPGVVGAALRYPAPLRFSLFGLETFGYQDTVIFPVTLTLAQPGQALALRPRLDLLVCEDICVPVSLDLALDLPAGAATPSDQAQILARWAAQVPVSPAAAGLHLAQLASDGAAIIARMTSETGLIAPDILIEAPQGWSFGPPQIRFSDNDRRATLTLPITQRPEPQAGLEGVAVTATLLDGRRAAETSTVVAPAASEPTGVTAWGLMLLTALAGGLILNVMPCVLPVLSLKLLGAARLGAGGRAMVRLGFLASAAGIITAFLLLGGALAGLKLAGVAVGWGIQFQQPLFLTAMVAVLTLFGGSLLGLMTITLPSGLMTRLGLAGGRGLGGQFLTGMFATLLATPCSAPLVGTAVGFALARGTGEILAIFAVLGLGLALPYLAVAAYPSAARLLPRPGRWLGWIKAGLGLALLGTGAWLLMVLAAQSSARVALAIGGLMLCVLALQAATLRRHGLRGWNRAGGVLAILGAFALVLTAPASMPSPAASLATGTRWQPFDRARIAPLVAEGQVVLVEVTADWCVTCIVNERGVLRRESVQQALAGPGITPMLADWTRPDAAILAYLADHGRYGIPFTAVYGPGAPQGLLLPELLTVQGLLDALQQAAGKPAPLAG